MLAQGYEAVLPQICESERLYVTPKLDGIRCIAAFDPSAGDICYSSRNGACLECCDHLSAALMPLFARDPTLVLDGELYTPELPFEDISGAVRRTRKHATAETLATQRLLRYFAFDVMYAKDLHNGRTAASAKVSGAPFGRRLEVLRGLIPQDGCSRPWDVTKKLPQPLFHVPAESFVASKGAANVAQAVDLALKKWMDKGFEGVMVRRDAFPYEFGTRSLGLLKYKRFEEAEFTILDVLEGKGRLKGRAGGIVCALTPLGKASTTPSRAAGTFVATPKAGLEQRALLLKRKKELIGKALTVQFQEYSRDGVPRFPIAKGVRGSADGSDWF